MKRVNREIVQIQTFLPAHVTLPRVIHIMETHVQTVGCGIFKQDLTMVTFMELREELDVAVDAFFENRWTGSSVYRDFRLCLQFVMAVVIETQHGLFLEIRVVERRRMAFPLDNLVFCAVGYGGVYFRYRLQFDAARVF